MFKKLSLFSHKCLFSYKNCFQTISSNRLNQYSCKNIKNIVEETANNKDELRKLKILQAEVNKYSFHFVFSNFKVSKY